VDDSNDNPIISTEAAEELQPSAAATEPSTTAASRQPPKRADLGLFAPAIAIIAWLVPGLGHLLLRRWGRGLAFFVAVGGLAMTGYLMRGNVFPPHSQGPFGTLGFIADACSGAFYLLARVVEASGPNVSRAVGDYGTRFIAAAGIVNVLGICDAYEIAAGRRR
jgi:hypothetical protein